MLRKRFLGLVVIAITLILAVSLLTVTGCNKGPSLKGKTILINDMAYDVDTAEPRNEGEERVLEARKKFLSDNGLVMRQVELGDYETHFQEMINMIMSGNKDFGIYAMGAPDAVKLYKQGLLFPLSDSSIARPDTEYNRMAERLFTFNGKVYATSTGKTNDYWQDGVILFNKRMLREIGEDPDLPYNMQRDGTWTWDNFHNLLRRLTVDLNNNGIIDQYGIAYENDANCGLLEALIFSNNADFVTLDANGVFHDATNSPAFLEALQFYQTLLNENLIKVPPEVIDQANPGAAAWDWYMSEFLDGRVAMILAPDWAVWNFTGGMVDDYGKVMPPKGPRATRYRVGSTCQIWAIPNIFTKAEVDVILTAFNGWRQAGQPPYDPDSWKEGWWTPYRDTRAVNETNVLQRDDANVTYKTHALVPGYIDVKSELTSMFVFATGTPSQYLEQFTPRFQAAIADANR
jgi:maltose-binding protein MalE